jgi:hypothetical protein
LYRALLWECGLPANIRCRFASSVGWVNPLSLHSFAEAAELLVVRDDDDLYSHILAVDGNAGGAGGDARCVRTPSSRETGV